MSAQQQKRFFETLLREIATGKHGKKSKIDQHRFDFSDVQVHNFFMSKKIIKKGLSDHLKTTENKGFIVRTVVLTQMEPHIKVFIESVKTKIRSLVQKDKDRYKIKLHPTSASELHATFDVSKGKSIYNRVAYTYKEAKNKLFKEYFKILGREKGKREDVLQLSHEEFAGAAEGAVSHALDLAVEAAGGGITRENAKKFLQDSGIDIRVIRDKKTDEIIVTFASAAENAADKEATKARLRSLRDIVSDFAKSADGTKRIVGMKGSDSIIDTKRKRAIQKLEKALDQPSLQLKFENSKTEKGKTTTTVKKRQKVRITTAKIGSGLAIRRSSVRKGISTEPLRLIGLINQRLPDTVRKNMNAPALQNVTGRFAESVKLTEIQKTPKGFPSFGYTYQKNPYQRFEMGRGDQPWATPERDPRTLIDKSIREIAAQFAIGRFYTRRV